MTVQEVISEYDVLGSPPDALRSVVELAAFVAEVPMATINIITDDAQHQLAAVGFDADICRREDSMCALNLHLGQPVAVQDASEDPRYRSNPFVTGDLGAVRFYANHPLVLAGETIGTLCVFDTVPREIDEHRTALLAVLAARIVDILELERRTRYLHTVLQRADELSDELRRSNDHLSAFAGQISHDLAGPLTSVTMSLHLLQEQFEEELKVPPSVENWVATGIRGTSRMQEMIRDILAFARLGGVLNLAPTDLGALAHDVRADLGITADDPRITIGDLPVVAGDATQLRAVLQNLVSNALKFGGPDPRVDLRAQRTEEGWRIEVGDLGPGIDPDDVERVFDPLVRANTEVEGTGIGLSTCRRIVQAHGGTIGIRPREGGGTTAWFQLPASRD
ncbi:ATP-binding protein [Microbacterium sp. BG28]|uniref:sensor histidine kinase n=1 Tax=Microbacterium sp. BG28 TaxID=3097356 RepID=UPI002A59A4E6|nr:ATP-binding protein [Microbacterium sp. BG28]MDY0829675.1 ATP-binding protein [Microbacterium sp. BG28]